MCSRSMALSDVLDPMASAAVYRDEEPLPLPLVVDLDGTLTPTDTLAESFCVALRSNLLVALLAPFWLLRGRAHLKRRVLESASYDPIRLPLREDLVAFLVQERTKGRRIVLATAADRQIADAVAARTGLFDDVIASDGKLNVKGIGKLELIRQQVGPDFVYAGDSRADLPVWSAACGAILVDVSTRVAQRVRSIVPVEAEFRADGGRIRSWLRLLRVHQWLKNTLIFLPLLTSFSFLQPDRVLASLVAFVVFCLVASATYIANDIWDLDSDRQHSRKRYRPLAAGTLSIGKAAGVGGAMLLTAFVLAFATSLSLLGAVLVYLVLTTAYSLKLKRHVLADCITLAVLYTLRVLAGAAAIAVQVTPWLLAFSVFAFFSLAILKRCSELVMLRQEGKRSVRGRDYQVTDLTVLWPMGIGASLSAVVIFGLFVANVSETQRYGHATLLWCVGVGLIYWFGRLWIKTERGEMHDDPIVFTLKDFGSRTVMMVLVLITITAYFL